MNKCAYTKIAKTALINWNDLTEKEAEALITKSTYEELESKIGAKNSVNASIDFMSIYLNLSDKEKEFLRKYTYGETENENLNIQAIKNKAKKCNQNELTMFALTGIHDVWVINNSSKFNKEGREDRKYQHLPIEMIGWKEAKADLIFLEPVLESIDVEMSEEKLHKLYDKNVKTFFKQNQFIDTKGNPKLENIENSILKGQDFYPALKYENTAKSKEEAEMITKQALKKTNEIINQTNLSL